MASNNISRWAGKSAWSLLDQALASLSGFTVSIILARILSTSQYGGYALALNIFLVFSSIHSSLILEPISVLGPIQHRDDLRSYIGNVAVIHAILTISVSVLIAVGSLMGQPVLIPVLISMAVSASPTLLFWVLRRTHYLDLRPDLASLSSLIYLITLLACLGILYFLKALNASTAFLAQGIASLPACIFSARNLGLTFRSVSTRDLVAEARELWGFGRWLLPSAIFYPMVTQAQLFLTAGLLGLGAAGVLRALQNPILPVLQVITAFGTLGLPAFSRYASQSTASGFFRAGALYACGLAGVASLYEIAVLLTGGLWDRVLYAGHFAPYESLMPVLGLMPIAAAITTAGSVLLRSALRPGLTTLVYVIGGVVGLVSSYLLIRGFAVPGAVYALTVSNFATAVVSFLLVVNLTRLRVGASVRKRPSA